MTKEEVVSALENAVDTKIIIKDWKVLKKLIEEYFKLKEKHSKILDDVHDYRYETHAMKMTIRNLCEHFGVKDEKELQNIYLNKPYKFEDLHEGMWVWDDKLKSCFEIFDIHKEDMSVEVVIHDKGVEYRKVVTLGKFEENRFYPLVKAIYREE